MKRNNGRPRVNGHGRASSQGAATHAANEQGSAASVDAGGSPVANAAVSTAAGTARDAYAEAAHAPNGKERLRHAEAEPRPRVSGDTDSGPQQNESEERPSRHPGPGEFPLPDDIADFVDEIHSRVDLFEILSGLLKSNDEKVKQRAVEKILEMKYGRSAETSDEPLQVIANGRQLRRD